MREIFNHITCFPLSMDIFSYAIIKPEFLLHPEESPPQYYQNIIKNSNDTHYWLHFSQLHAMSFIYKVVAWNVIFFPITIKLFKFVFRAAKHPDNSLWQKVKDKKIRVVVLHLNEYTKVNLIHPTEWCDDNLMKTYSAGEWPACIITTSVS